MIKVDRSLLTSEERVICEQISRQDQGLYGQRARVLLALDEGLSQARAGDLAGLTEMQAGQCLASFRQLRTAGIYSEQAETQETACEPVFTSQLGVTDSNIEDSVTHLKQTQSVLKRHRATTTAGPEPRVNQEPADSDDSPEEPDSEPVEQAQMPEETIPVSEPEKQKKAGKKAKKVKPKKKPGKKPKKKPRKRKKPTKSKKKPKKKPKRRNKRKNKKQKK